MRRLLVPAFLAALALAPASLAARPWPGVPPSFVPKALCVHDGWWHQQHAPYARARDVPDSIAGGSGEGTWKEVDAGTYFSGWQFTLATWNRAASLSRGRVPRVSSGYRILDVPPAVQMLAVYLIVRSDGWSFREWPQTGAACGLPQ